MQMGAIGGTAYLRCTTRAGETFDVALRGKWRVSPSRYSKTGVAGQDRVHGYTVKAVVPMMEGDVSDTPETDVRRIDDAVGITATLELVNGKTWVGVDGWRADISTIDTEEGSIPVKFEFASIDLI